MTSKTKNGYVNRHFAYCTIFSEKTVSPGETKNQWYAIVTDVRTAVREANGTILIPQFVAKLQ